MSAHSEENKISRHHALILPEMWRESWKYVAALFVTAAFLFVAPGVANADDTKPTAVVDAGMLAGTTDGTVNVFKGIPYAAPPVGALRWEPPALSATWTGTRDASAFGAVCPQPPPPVSDAKMALGAELGANMQSEDCLYLNVWTFSGAKKAPVMVWIHGGAGRFGSGSMRAFDGTNFAKDGVILVTFNYRLGTLGSFAHPALTNAAKPDAWLGDYGIMDQIAALQWVKRNAAAFGGDSSNVTVFGESAGGVYVLTLLTVPASRGLFAKAIVESGGGWYPEQTLQDKEKEGVAIASAAGLGAGATVAQLRALPLEKLVNAPMTMTTASGASLVDGRFIKEGIPRAFAAGHERHVPLIIGSNSDEASLLKLLKLPPALYISIVPASARALYPGSDDDAAAAIFNDRMYGAPARWIATQASSYAPAFIYHFSYVPTLQRGSMQGAPHGSEIPFVFGQGGMHFLGKGSQDDDPHLSVEDRAMSALMHACWVSFAKTGQPACGDEAWPAYTPATNTSMEFDVKSGPVVNFRKTQYDALQSVLSQLVPGN